MALNNFDLQIVSHGATNQATLSLEHFKTLAPIVTTGYNPEILTIGRPLCVCNCNVEPAWVTESIFELWVERTEVK